MILLYCEHEIGSAAFGPATINGMQAESRSYTISNHFVEVTGNGNEVVAFDDAQNLCEMGIYRLATPNEQNAYSKQQRKQKHVVEEEEKVKTAKTS
jgi:hypothetical protein